MPAREPERCQRWKGSRVRHSSFKHRNTPETGLEKSGSGLLRVSCYRYKCRALKRVQRWAREIAPLKRGNASEMELENRIWELKGHSNPPQVSEQRTPLPPSLNVTLFSVLLFVQKIHLQEHFKACFEGSALPRPLLVRPSRILAARTFLTGAGRREASKTTSSSHTHHSLQTCHSGSRCQA